MALGNTSALLVCSLALRHSNGHQRRALRSLLLCARAIAGCFAVLLLRRYRGHRSLVCALVACAEEAGFQAKRTTKLSKEKKENKNTATLRINPEKTDSPSAIAG